VRRLHLTTYGGFCMCKTQASNSVRKLVTVPTRFGRPYPPSDLLPSLLAEAGRLRAFTPPFRFTSFFSPEDTLLCVCASEAALSHARLPGSEMQAGREPTRIAELTSGSGLVGLQLLRVERNSTLLGLDIDEQAADVASENAEVLGLSGRATFAQADLWSDDTAELLAGARPHLLVCNPPYVPEPSTGDLAREAGSGADGTAHLMKTLELAGRTRPRALALSWCSLSDPALVVDEAERTGYRLNSLFVAVIADGEYSGSVREYLRTLPHAYTNDQPSTMKAVAPDGSAVFAYLLMAGEFSRGKPARGAVGMSKKVVERMCADFSRRGINALLTPSAPFPVRASLLDRWDELRLRAFLHGQSEKMAEAVT